MSENAVVNEYGDIFEKGGWEYVRQAIWRGVLRRFHTARRHEVEDAVSHAMTALVDTWLDRPGSVSDDLARNTSYACWWGIGEASQYLASVYAENALLVGLVDEGDEGAYPVTVGPDGIEAEAIENDPPSGSDELLRELENLSDEDLKARLEPLWKGGRAVCAGQGWSSLHRSD